MRPAKFTLESLGYVIFNGFSKDEEWNGWDCPYFTFEQAQKVLTNFNVLHQITGNTNLAFYDSETDAFIFPADEEQLETFAAIGDGDQKYYPVGAFSWIWEETKIE